MIRKKDSSMAHLANMKMRWKLVVPIVLTICIIAAFLPYKQFIEFKINAAFVEKGFAQPVLHIEHIGWNSAVISGIRVGHDVPFLLHNVTVNYTFNALWHGQLDSISLEGMTIEGYIRNGKFLINGLEPLFNRASAADTPMVLPVDKEVFSQLPFQSIEIRASRLHVTGDGIDMLLPFHASLQLLPTPHLHIVLSQAYGQYGGYDLSAKNIDIRMALNEQQQGWSGAWSMEDVSATGMPLALPPLQGKGTLTALNDRLTTEFAFENRVMPSSMQASVVYRLDKPAQSALHVKAAQMSWGEGKVGIRNLVMELRANPQIAATVEISKVSLDAVLKAATGGRATATGEVSGVLPITRRRDGAIHIDEGALRNEESGVIHIQPEAIPGDNAQIAKVRDILQNFHYDELVLTIGSSPNGKLALHVAVRGNNPDAYNGKAVNLQVHLTGDMLQLLQQTLMPLHDPKQFLQ